MLRRWQKLCETDQGFTDVFFGRSLQCCGILYSLSLSSQVWLWGEGECHPWAKGEELQGATQTADLVSATLHPQAWVHGRVSLELAEQRQVHLLGGKRDGRAKAIVLHGSDVGLTWESQLAHEESLERGKDPSEADTLEAQRLRGCKRPARTEALPVQGHCGPRPQLGSLRNLRKCFTQIKANLRHPPRPKGTGAHLICSFSP